MKDYPDDSPNPYTHEQLQDVARALGLGKDIDHESVRRVVGITRAFVSQQQRSPNQQLGFIERQAEAAAKAAKLETRLEKIYKNYPMLGSAAAMHFRAKYHQSLYEANKGTASRGRKKPYHKRAALVGLYAVWTDVNGKQENGKEAFIAAALEPFGYSPDQRAFDEDRKEALKILKRRN